MAPPAIVAPEADLDFRAVTDALPALVSFFDAEGICRYANRSHSDWYGVSPASLIGRPVRDFLGAEVLRSQSSCFLAAMRGERASFEARVPHRVGGWRDAAVHLLPRETLHGAGGTYVFIIDVASHLHRFQTVFEGGTVGYLIIDLAERNALFDTLDDVSGPAMARLCADPAFVRRVHDSSIIIDANARACQMLDATLDQLRGSRLGHWYPDSNLPEIARVTCEIAMGAKDLQMEATLVGAKGREVHALASTTFPGSTADDTTVAIAMTDITELVHRNRDLAKANASLAHAARVATLGELTASIAHEVNQPLAAIAANGSAALRWLTRPVPDIGEATQAIDRLVAEARRASAVIARTRALARKADPRHERVDLSHLMRETAAILQRQLQGLGADLVLELSPGVEVDADRIQLQQVAINLVLNAAQAMADANCPKRVVTLGVVPDGKDAIMRVADTGPGIPLAIASTLFEPFNTTKPAGMGLGLSVTRSIVEAHGGRVVAETAPSGGASFVVTLPRANELD